MLLLEIAFFHDLGDFGQRLLTACWPPVTFENGNLERVIWTPFLPNIMVRNLILASGGQKKLFFCPQPTCWNNHLQIYIVTKTHKKNKVPSTGKIRPCDTFRFWVLKRRALGSCSKVQRILSFSRMFANTSILHYFKKIYVKIVSCDSGLPDKPLSFAGLST